MSFGGHDTHCETAQRIERDNPAWIVVWGVYTREYVAFPKFRAPPGTMLCSRNPNTLAAGMRQIEFTFNPRAEPEGSTDAGARRSMLRPHDYT